jgi:hypothetical protein
MPARNAVTAHTAAKEASAIPTLRRTSVNDEILTCISRLSLAFAFKARKFQPGTPSAARHVR